MAASTSGGTSGETAVCASGAGGAGLCVETAWGSPAGISIGIMPLMPIIIMARLRA